MSTLEVNAGDLFPNMLFIPQNIESILWIKFNTATQDERDNDESKWTDLIYMPWKEFETRQLMLDNTASNVDWDDGVRLPYARDDLGGMTIKWTTDAPPQFWSTPDDLCIFFDSYDSTVNPEGVLPSYTQIYGRRDIRWRYDLDLTDADDADIMDDVVVVLDPEYQTILENEAIALAWAEKKQTQHVTAEKAARRGLIRNQGTKEEYQGGQPMDKFPDYGRKGRGGRGPYFTKGQRSGS